MYSCLKFPSQVYHRPSMPHTEFINFNITRTKSSYIVASYMVLYVTYYPWTIYEYYRKVINNKESVGLLTAKNV